jgi:N-acyl-D-aspartate/D-glutamate deacylase
MSHDVHIRGGRVIDGTGAPSRQVDVAIDGGRVVEIAEHLDGTATRTIEADGRIVSPGFVDLHTHYDIQAFWDATLSPSPLHGVTSAIAGNCGFSVAPLHSSQADYLMQMLARVEGMPLASLAAATDWGWTSFASYLDRLEGQVVPNLGFLAGHSAIRRVVMGPAATERTARPDEITAMRALLGQSLEEGALGFSSSWAPTHLDGDGQPVPSRSADQVELLELCDEVRRHPSSAIEFIPGLGDFTDAEGDLMGAMSAAADRPLNWNVLVVMAGLADKVRTQLAASDRAAAQGGRVLGLTIPMSVRPRLSFASGFLLDTIPGWQGPMTEPHADRLARLASPERRAELLASAGDAQLGLANFGQYVLTECTTPETSGYEGRTVADVAAERGADPFDVLCDIAVDNDLRTGFSFPPYGDTEADWQARLGVWRDPRAIIGASDAGAHLDFLATFNYPTVLLRRAVADLGLLSWEEAISLLSNAPARLYGLTDRGQLREGAHADVVVLDPDRVGPEPVVSRIDLPAGGWRLYGGATGIDHVLVNGVEVVTDGVIGEARPGTILRSGRDTTTVTARS